MPADQTSMLVEVQTDLRWIRQGLDAVPASMSALESRVTDKVQHESQARDKSVSDMQVQVNEAKKTAEDARAHATAAQDASRRILWVCAGVLTFAMGAVVALLRLVYEISTKLRVLP